MHKLYGQTFLYFLLEMSRLLAQIIRLRAQFPNYAIKKIHLDNAGELKSQAFNDYCMSIGIDVEHPIACARARAHTHTHT